MGLSLQPCCCAGPHRKGAMWFPNHRSHCAWNKMQSFSTSPSVNRRCKPSMLATPTRVSPGGAWTQTRLSDGRDECRHGVPADQLRTCYLSGLEVENLDLAAGSVSVSHVFTQEFLLHCFLYIYIVFSFNLFWTVQGLAQANHLHFWCLVFRCFQIFRIKTQDSLLSLPRWMCFAWSSTWTNFSISWGRRSWTLQMGTSSQKLGSWQDNFWRRSRSWRKPTSKKCARTEQCYCNLVLQRSKRTRPWQSLHCRETSAMWNHGYSTPWPITYCWLWRDNWPCWSPTQSLRSILSRSCTKAVWWLNLGPASAGGAPSFFC